jgi:septum formation protein
MVRRLAYEKCESVLARKLPSHSVVLASDTTVIAPSGAVLEKPKNRRDADRMLKLLSGQTHEVLTAYCIGSKGAFRIRRVVKTRVTFRKIDALELQAYLKTSEPYDKAGAYAAQGFAMAWIHKIQGSYTNVVGLPMTEVAKDLLENFSIAPLWRQV